jgi:hypothetical protein
MSNTVDDMNTIARVRRAMPRNADVMRICEIAEAHLIVRREISEGVLTVKRADVAAAEIMDRSGFDRKKYQRDYMRKKRAK